MSHWDTVAVAAITGFASIAGALTAVGVAASAVHF
jgi:hypothetical protein